MGGMVVKVYIEPTTSGNILSTVVIGDKYLDSWMKNALPSWINYCKKYQIGLIVFEKDILDKKNEKWKKANWQKLLIGSEIYKRKIDITNVCYLDSDILISPLAKNIFLNYNKETICVVSQIKNLPQPLDLTLRRLAFLRHTNWDRNYPLDSALFMPPEEIFKFHNLPSYNDYICTGFFIFNIVNHQDLLKKWFDKYDKNIDSITGGGEEPYLNYELFNWGKLSWLPYEYQALWTYEVAWKYPFLFNYGKNDQNLIRKCIESSLYTNNFLHFAGSWNECEMWKIGGFFDDESATDELKEYLNYLDTPVFGNPQGVIRPKY